MGALRDLFIRVRGDKSGLDSTLKGAEGSLNSFGSIVKKIGGLLGIAFGVSALVSWSKEAMKLAAEAEGVKNAFNNIAGSANLMNQMIKSTRGAVDDSDLMSLAIKAQNLGIPLKDLGTLFEFATNRAITTGKSVNEMVELIVMGVGRKSSRALLQLGINTDVAGKAFKSVAGIMPVINSELDKMGSVADSAAIRIGALETNFKNLKEAWGGFLNNSKLVQTAITNLTALFKMLGDESLTAWQKLTMGPKDYQKYINAIAERQSVIDNAKPPEPIKDQPIIIDPEEAKKEAEALEKLKKEYKAFWAETEQVGNLPQNNKTKSVFDKKTFGLAPPVSGALAGGPAGGDQSIANSMAAGVEDLSYGLNETQESLLKLSKTFAGFFSGVNLGFQGMIDGVITGIKRLVLELLAQAIILTLLTLITGGTVNGAMFKSLLPAGLGKIVGSGGGGSASVGSIVSQNQLMASIDGRMLKVILRRDV